MLICCYNVYNEAEYGFEESIKSIRPHVDFIVVVDGAYAQFPHRYPQSTDGTIEIAKRYADCIITRPHAWADQIHKRNAYLIGGPGDIYLMMDGHEIFNGELKPPFGDYRLKMLMADGWHEQFRMFKYRPDLEYREKDYMLFTEGKCLGQEFPVYPYGHLIHPDIKYNQERLMAREVYFSMPRRWAPET